MSQQPHFLTGLMSVLGLEPLLSARAVCALQPSEPSV